jgi:hypothetical protein
MNASVVVDPQFGFGLLDERLKAMGFTRDESVQPVTPDILPGERELAAWTRGKSERLTYTFNPVVSLRVIDGIGLPAGGMEALCWQIPLVDANAIGKLLNDDDSRRVLLGLLAARILRTQEIAPLVVPLTFHGEQVIRRAAAETIEALAFGTGATARQKALTVMQVLAQRAIAPLSALVGPDGPGQLESMRPRAEDFARVFRPEIADAVRAAFEELWRDPPRMERLESGELTLRVDAAPAGMLSEDNELSRHFPGGYRALAPYLVPDRIWFVWRYIQPGEYSGMRYDGVVMLDDRWVWFPKAYRVVGEILENRRNPAGFVAS